MFHSKFDLLEQLTSSPIGKIYRGCNLDQQSEVAILEISPHFKDDNDSFNDIWNSILPVCNLKHDYLVPVIDLDKTKGWIIMELRDTPLTKIIRKGPLPHNVARTILRDILDVLDYLQSHQVIHGDIRPDTLLLPHQGGSRVLSQQRVKLGFSPGATLCGEIPLGQRDSKYLAPEMINGELGQLSAATDLYLLAFTILESLVGPMFDSRFAQIGQDRDSLWYSWHGNAARELPSPGDLVPDLPDDLATVLSLMLRKNVEERPSSARDVQKMLSVTEDEPIPPTLLGSGVFSGGDATSGDVQITSDWSSQIPSEDGDASFVSYAVPPSSSSASLSSKKTKKATPRTSGASSNVDCPKRWSRQWIDIQFKKPYILWPFAVIVLSCGGLIGLMLQPEERVDVVIKTDPSDVEITIGPTLLQPVAKKKDTYNLPVRSLVFVFSKEGYEPLEMKLAVTEKGKLQDENGKDVDIIRLVEMGTPLSDVPTTTTGSQPEPPEEPLSDIPSVSAPPQDDVPIQEEPISFDEDDAELYPVTLRVIPSDATIVFGDLRGTGEVVIQFDPNDPLEVEYSHPDYQTEIVKLDDLSKAGEVFDIEEGDILIYSMNVGKKDFENLPDTLLPVEGTDVDEQYMLPIFAEVAILKETAPMQMTLITPGRFSFGVASGRHIYPGELKAVDVAIDMPYYIAVHEVTQKQYAQYHVDNEKQSLEIPPHQAELPVVNISHSEAALFCQWIGGVLPTEAEWEYAAMFPGEKTDYPWGDAPFSEEHVNLFETNHGSAVSVMENPQGANLRGISHLIGNVSEWCMNSYQAGSGESEDNELIQDAFVIRSPSFFLPFGPEVRLTWRAPVKNLKKPDIGFRPIIYVEDSESRKK